MSLLHKVEKERNEVKMLDFMLVRPDLINAHRDGATTQLSFKEVVKELMLKV